MLQKMAEILPRAPMDDSMPPVMEAKESGIRNLDLNCRSLLAKRGFGIDSNFGYKEKEHDDMRE